MRGTEWISFLIFLVLVYLQVFLSLKIPEYMSHITELMQKGISELTVLAVPAVKMLLLSIGSLACAVISGICLSFVSATIITKMREDLFSKIISFNLVEMKSFSASSLITRCTNDLEQVRLFISVGVQAIIQCPLTLIMAVSKMRGNAVWMGAVIAMAAILLIVTAILFSLSLSKTKKVQRLIDDANRIMKEHLSGMRVVHAYNGYQYQRSQFDKTNSELMRTNISATRYTGALAPFFSMCVNSLTLIIYILGSYMIYTMDGVLVRQALFSDMVVFASYALQAFNAFAMIIVVLIAMPRLIISLRRIIEVIDTENEIKDGPATAGCGDTFGTIEFQNVSFRYPDASADSLSDISFSLRRGETMAIIGPTGSGKTTLLNLIMRFYDATDGTVYVDGRDVRDYNLWALRDKIGYVPQKSFLFAGTIRTNIDYGAKGGLASTIGEIKKAAEVGQSREFIEQKEGKFDARVEEGGSNFSGGQRQRLTISRAICRNPEFYLFDDSFSALDFKTDSVLRNKLKEYAKYATQVIVGQRIGSIMNADLILVLDKGRLAGKGKHEELMENCSVYREIALSQLLSEEVANG